MASLCFGKLDNRESHSDFTLLINTTLIHATWPFQSRTRFTCWKYGIDLLYRWFTDRENPVRGEPCTRGNEYMSKWHSHSSFPEKYKDGGILKPLQYCFPLRVNTGPSLQAHWLGSPFPSLHSLWLISKSHSLHTSSMSTPLLLLASQNW